MALRLAEKIFRDQVAASSGWATIWGYSGGAEPNPPYVSLQYILAPTASMIDTRRERLQTSIVTISAPGNTNLLGLTVNGVPSLVQGVVGDANATALALATQLQSWSPNITVTHTAPSNQIDISGPLFAISPLGSNVAVATVDGDYIDAHVMSVLGTVQIVAISTGDPSESLNALVNITAGLEAARRDPTLDLSRVYWAPVSAPLFQPTQNGSGEWYYRALVDVELRYTYLVPANADVIETSDITLTVS